MKVCQFLTSKGDEWLFKMLQNMHAVLEGELVDQPIFVGLDDPAGVSTMLQTQSLVDKAFRGRLHIHCFIHPSFSGRGLGCAGDFLNFLVDQGLNAGCDRFLHLNDDISMTRYYLQYLEQASSFGKYAVIPDDGIHQPPFNNFHYFGIDYMADVYPEGKVYADTDQIYWHDTEFILRAFCANRLKYEPRAKILHLNWTNLPAMCINAKERNQSERIVQDARAFVQRVKHLPLKQMGISFAGPDGSLPLGEVGEILKELC